MNLWKCDRKPCTAAATGTGSALGLRSIGWWVEPGTDAIPMPIYCPDHRPARDYELWRTEALQALLKVMENEAHEALLGSGKAEGLMVGVRGLRAILGGPQ